MSMRCSLPKVQKRNLHRQNEFSLSRMLAGAEKEEKIWVCPQGHTFDIAAKGYVNLLMSNSSGAKRHGDDRLMINARRDFLSKGFYEPLREAVYDALSADFPRGGTLLDAGCGECWYTSYFKNRLGESGLEPQVLGVDISKYALEKAPKNCGVERAVASIYKLPVGGGECDAIVNIFAPACPQEFSRVLKKTVYSSKQYRLKSICGSSKALCMTRRMRTKFRRMISRASASSVKRRYAILLRSKAGRI